MRCVECEPDPLAAAQFCECCGRRVSTEEEATGTPAVAPCGSCGGPSIDGDLCQACHDAFAPMLANAAPAASAAPAPDPTTDWAPASTGWWETQNEDTARADAAKVEAARAEAAREEAARVEAERAEAARYEAAREEAVRAELARAAAAKAEAAQRERAQVRAERPPVPGRLPPIAQPASGRTRSTMLGVAAAAVVIVAAINAPAAARWLGVPWPLEFASAVQTEELQEMEPPEPPAPDPAPKAPVRASKAPSTTPAAAKPGVAAKKPGAPVQKKPAPSARPPAKPASSGQQVASVAPGASRAPGPVPEAFRPPVTMPSPAPTTVIGAPRSLASVAAAGRFFEPKDVDESPRVETRVEPRLPAGLAARAVNDVVIVRVLVSQTGHPSRVSLLRRSKHGESLDDAVIAAVTQWTFSPARKRGEPVSSWYNVGVPIGQTN